MTQTYHFGVPSVAVWTSHILIGLFLAYVGYNMIENKKLPKYVPITLIVLGVLALLYHAHLWYYVKSGGEKKEPFGVDNTKGYYDKISQEKLSY